MILNKLGHTNMRRGLLMAACATTIYAAPAFAQTAAPVEAREVEEVVVTATRRETALQSVAIAVTAVGAEALQNAGVKDIRDLQQLAPSLQVPVSESSASVTARIRGVGTQGSNPGLESSVGVFVDGVYRARNGVAFGDLGEMRSVEVLRGPQGTLFGRNTSAGLISVNTKKPSFEWGATGDLTYGNYNTGGGSLGITGPLIEDKLAGRLYVAARTRGGYVTVNPSTAAFDSNDSSYVTIRGQLLFTPSETYDGRLIVDLSERAEACCAAPNFLATGVSGLINYVRPGSVQLNNGLESNEAIVTPGRNYDQTIKDQGISYEFNWDVGPGKLTSVSAWRNWEYHNNQDSDFTGLDLAYRDTKANGDGTEFTTITQEVRYAGSVGKLDYLVGGFYSNETIDVRNAFRIGADYETWIGALFAGAGATSLPVNYVAPVSPFGSATSLPDVVRRAAALGVLLPKGGLGVAAANRLLPAFNAGSGISDKYEQKAESVALFTHNIYNFSDDFSVTLGLRYTQEDKELRADYNTVGTAACAAIEGLYGLNPTAELARLSGEAAGAGNAPLAASYAGAISPAATICLPWQRRALDNLDHNQARSEKEWSGVGTVSYRFNDSINSYATYSHGYKAGGFNLDRAFTTASGAPVVSGMVGSQTVTNSDTSFGAETVDSFEIGLKTQWFNRAVTANFAIYHQTFENFQLNTFTGISFIVTPVPEVIAQGFEADFFIRPPVEGLTLSGGFAYSDSKYGKSLGSASDPTSWLGRNLGQYLLPGNQLTSAPEWTFGGAVNYERTIFGNLLSKSYIDFRHVGETVTGSNLDPRKTQSEYTLVNGKLIFSDQAEKWAIEFWGRNLTDKRYAQITFDAFLQGSSPTQVRSNTGVVTTSAPTSRLGAFTGEPRTYGVTLRWSF